MKLYIKKIVIEKNGKIIEKHNFGGKINVVHNTDICDVIKCLLGICEPKKSLYNMRFFAVVELEQIYYIRGKKEKGSSTFTSSIYKEDTDVDCCKEYFDFVKQYSELDSVIFFNKFKRQDYPHKLLKYKDLLTYYPNGDFSELTNGYGKTRSFRGFVTNYIKHFKPVRLREGKEGYLKLSKDGEFTVGYLNNDEKVYLSESETMLYHYLSFISITDFWSRAEKIRNLNRVNKPLIVSGFFEFLDDSIDLSELLRHTNKLTRQVILIVPKGVKIPLYNESSR